MFRRIKIFLQDYFSFTSRERRGAIILLTVLLLVIVAPYVWNAIAPPKMKPMSEFSQQITFSDSGKINKDSTENNNSNNLKQDDNKLTTLSIEINSADSTSFEKIHGIKRFIAARIIKYRHALGGFYSVEQLKEVYGLKPGIIDSNLTHFRVDISQIKKININTANDDELKHQPYIGYSLAKVIVEYRTRHGNFNSTADIKNIVIVTDDTYKKVLPYLTVK